MIQMKQILKIGLQRFINQCIKDIHELGFSEVLVCNSLLAFKEVIDKGKINFVVKRRDTWT